MVEYSSKIYEGEKDQKADEKFSMGAPVEKTEPSNGDSSSKPPDGKIRKSDSHSGNGSQLIQPPDHSYSAEQFRKVKTHILHRSTIPRSILITSALPEEGKSIVAFNLALSFAQEKNFQTILIDADLRKASVLPKLLPLKEEVGLSDYLRGQKSWENILYRIPNHGLRIIPGGTYSQERLELNGFSRIKELLDVLLKKAETGTEEEGKEKETGTEKGKNKGKEKENVIFIDAPPILVASEPIILSKLVDGIILVVMSGVAPKKTIRKAVESIGREKIIGVVFNQIHLKPSKYYYQFHDRSYRE